MSQASAKFTRHALIVGAGFVGEALARQLLDSGWTVSAITKHGRSADELSQRLHHSRLSVYSGDLTESSTLESIVSRFQAPPEVIIQSASSGRGGIDLYREIFLHLPPRLIRQFPGIPIVFCSSTSVYGQTDGSLVDESSPTIPSSETSAILVEAEQRLLADEQSPGTVMRLAGLYGIGRAHLLSKWARGDASIDGTECDAEGRYINQVHVEDAASAIRWICEHPHLLKLPAKDRVWNVVDNTPIRQRAFYQSLLPFAPPGSPQALPPVCAPDPKRKRGWTDKQVSNQKLRDAGWSPKYPDVQKALQSAKDIQAYL